MWITFELHPLFNDAKKQKHVPQFNVTVEASQLSWEQLTVVMTK